MNKHIETRPATAFLFFGRVLIVAVSVYSFMSDHVFTNSYILSPLVTSNTRGDSKQLICSPEELGNRVCTIVSGAIKIHNEPRVTVNTTMNY